MTILDAELISYILAGLGPEYEFFVTSMSHQSTLTIDDLYANLISYEKHVVTRQATELQ